MNKRSRRSRKPSANEVGVRPLRGAPPRCNQSEVDALAPLPLATRLRNHGVATHHFWEADNKFKHVVPDPIRRTFV
jgi:hypothetical protein